MGSKIWEVYSDDHLYGKFDTLYAAMIFVKALLEDWYSDNVNLTIKQRQIIEGEKLNG